MLAAQFNEMAGADPAAPAVRPGQDSRRAADGRSGGRFPVRPGDRDRRRRTGAAHQPRGASRSSGPRRRCSASPSRTSPTTRACRWRCSTCSSRRRSVASEEGAAIVPLVVDGAERSFRQRTTPMRDADNRLVGAVMLLEDITHLREIDRLKSEFIATASHELRTPLTSLEMGVHLLLEGSAGELSREAARVAGDVPGRYAAARQAGEGSPGSVENRVGQGGTRSWRQSLRASWCSKRWNRCGARSKRRGSPSASTFRTDCRGWPRTAERSSA